MTDLNPSNAQASTFRIPVSDPWAHVWKALAALAAVGGVAAWFGYTGNPERFAFSYLFAFLCFLFIGLGAIFYVLILHLTSAGWGVSTRRTAEFFCTGVPVLALLFLPILAVLQHLYPWYGHDVPQTKVSFNATLRGHAEEQPGSIGEQHAVHPLSAPQTANGAAIRHTSGGGHHAAHLAHEAVVQKKHAYLNQPFFLIRALLYFAVWIFLAWRVVSLSLKQDETKDPHNTVKLKRMSAPGIIVLALTLTFASFDWIMSLEPAWYSTIFGVYLFGSSAVAIFAVVIVTTLALRAGGFLADAVNVEHYHDLGKLMFGFIVFWAYIGFSQLLLIWYAGLPEEATFYHLRWDGGLWQRLSLFLLVGHFFFPFALILSRNAKRKLAVLGFAAVWMLVLHVVEMYWFVMPYYSAGHFEMHWLDLACLLWVGGIYTAVVFRRMTRHALIPIGDPRLDRSLRFENP
ncbi:MAG: quinol:cytochrome C oxidoreductase [Myxococcales bacterium]|nr:quinol:cytochrome C oxidoreductase [Myxococcales bacterium]